MKTIINQPSKEAYERAGQILKNGGIVAFPTDTVYGLGAVYKDKDAVSKIFEAKGRDEKKPLSILISDISEVKLLADEISPKAHKLMRRYWPGALTLVFKKKEGIPDNVTAGKDTIGIRMPSSDVARNIIKEAGSPLATPSANTSGKRSSVTAKDVEEDLDGKIDMLIDGGACDIGIASTVVDVTKEPFEILREGVITKEMIKTTIENI